MEQSAEKTPHIVTKYSHCSVHLSGTEFSGMLCECTFFFGDFHVEFMS